MVQCHNCINYETKYSDFEFEGHYETYPYGVCHRWGHDDIIFDDYTDYPDSCEDYYEI